MSASINITFDPEADALYICFLPGTVTTRHPVEGIALDFDSEGRLAGIEILDASRRIGSTDAFKSANISIIR
jgi:uncharacterized protein YuzE